MQQVSTPGVALTDDHLRFDGWSGGRMLAPAVVMGGAAIAALLVYTFVARAVTTLQALLVTVIGGTLGAVGSLFVFRETRAEVIFDRTRRRVDIIWPRAVETFAFERVSIDVIPVSSGLVEDPPQYFLSLETPRTSIRLLSTLDRESVDSLRNELARWMSA